MNPPHAARERTCPLLPPVTDLKDIKLERGRRRTSLNLRLPLQNGRSTCEETLEPSVATPGQVSAPTAGGGG